MKYKLEEDWINLIRSASNTLNIAYDKDIDGEGYIEIDVLLQLIEELNDAVNHVQEEFGDYKQETEENYVPRYKDIYDFYGINRNDF